MWKKIAVAGAITAATLGAGTAALAASGSTVTGTPAPSGSSSSASTPAAKSGQSGKDGAKHSALARALHGQWVTRDGKTGSGYTTHDVIRGSVTAVSSTSITIKAVDNTTETYAVTSATKVRHRANGSGSASTIGAVHTGDTAEVLGTGTTSLTATGIVYGTK